MDVVILLVFISLILVSLGLIFFIYRLKGGDFEHGDRLSLLPLAEDEIRGVGGEAGGAKGPEDPERPAREESRSAP